MDYTPYRTQAEVPVEEQPSPSFWERLSETLSEAWRRYFFLRALAYASGIVSGLCILIGTIGIVIGLCVIGHPVWGASTGIVISILGLATLIYFVERK